MDLNYDFTLLLLIFLRMSGCILFNPILGRRNIPAIEKIGLALALTIFTYPMVHQTVVISSVIVLAFSAVKELMIGLLIGLIMQMFMAVIIMGGEQIDMQIGISMSKIYDPQSNVAMPLSASIINAMFILIFFITNAHITLIKIFALLGTAVPYGDTFISSDAYQYILQLFSLILIYSAKLALPIVAVQMVCQIGVGLVMRAVPQIDIFTVEIQLKLIIGFAAIMVLAPVLSTFIETLIGSMFGSISNLYTILT